MPKLIPLSRESFAVIPEVDDMDQNEHALNLFRLAGRFLESNPTLYYDNSGRLNREATTQFKHDQAIKLSVWAGVARSVLNGTDLIAVSLDVSEEVGDMSLYMQRKDIKRYRLRDDPFVEHLEGFFRRHLM